MKNKRRRIFLLIFLIIIILIEIRAFRNSVADKLIDITATITDNSSLLAVQEYTTKASTDSEGRYCFSLPNVINNYKVDKYLIEEKEIEDTTKTEEQNENKAENKIQNKEASIVEKNPGELVYLTEEELNSKKINLTVEYVKKEKDNKTLYQKVLEEEKGENVITLEGYLPADSTITVEKVETEVASEKLKDYINEKTQLKVAYDIKIISEEKEYEPKDIGENIKVTIKGQDVAKEENKNYKMIHIDNENKTEEVETIEHKEDTISFETDEFSTYALLEEETTEENTVEQPIEEVTNEVAYSTRSADIHTSAPWDGITIATKFCWGAGTEEAPFLISNGSELAYLAQQVRNGNTYEGQYFQLACDIDLGNREWTPIGNNQNSFRGIFDGAGHTIGNARIAVTSLPDRTYETYGIFGSIGGGNTKTIIRNLELSNININISASGDTGSTSWTSVNQDSEGLHIGTLSGAMYKNTNVQNVIVKNSLIEDSQTINITHYPFQLSIGGVIGYATNGYDNNSDIGNNETYIIENCYSETVIDIDATTDVVTNGGLFNPRRDGRAQYHTGGIIGTIRAQVVWPTNCLYSGNINSNGFIGPIFGALINNEDYTSSSNYNNIWSGNDGGNSLTPDNMYYTNYQANGRTFTGTVTGNPSNSDRYSTNSSNIGYVQGVNKGTYTNNMNTVLNVFNSNVTEENKYVNWFYQDGSFTFKERLTATVEENIEYTYEIAVDDPYEIGEYTVYWYKNGELDPDIQGLTYVCQPNYQEDEEMQVIIFDNEYYTVVKFTIKKIGVDIVFNVNNNTDSVTASLEGEGMKYTSVEDYTFQWYEEDLAGEGRTN